MDNSASPLSMIQLKQARTDPVVSETVTSGREMHNYWYQCGLEPLLKKI